MASLKAAVAQLRVISPPSPHQYFLRPLFIIAGSLPSLLVCYSLPTSSRPAVFLRLLLRKLTLRYNLQLPPTPPLRPLCRPLHDLLAHKVRQQIQGLELGKMSTLRKLQITILGEARALMRTVRNRWASLEKSVDNVMWKMKDGLDLKTVCLTSHTPLRVRKLIVWQSVHVCLHVRDLASSIILRVLTRKQEGS